MTMLPEEGERAEGNWTSLTMDGQFARGKSANTALKLSNISFRAYDIAYMELNTKLHITRSIYLKNSA